MVTVYKALTAFLLNLCLAAPAFAQDDESYVAYENIINELKASANSPIETRVEKVNWSSVALQGGLAFTTSYLSINSPKNSPGLSARGFLKGYEAHLGFNLFSEKARAEGVFRSFARDQIVSDVEAALKEFELRIIFLPQIERKTRLRMGAGLSSRILTVQSQSLSGPLSSRMNTPATSLLLGLEHKVFTNVTIGPDFSYRSALIVDSFDKSSIDASFRLNATF